MIANMETTRDFVHDTVLFGEDFTENQEESKIPILLLNQKKIDRLMPVVRDHEKQLHEFWEALARLKKEVKLAVTQDELSLKIVDCGEVVSNKVSYDIQA